MRQSAKSAGSSRYLSLINGSSNLTSINWNLTPIIVLGDLCALRYSERFPQKILENLDHRGAVGADKLMGDGAGILVQLPDALYREEMARQGVELPPPGEYGVGMIFLPKEHASRLACEQELERAIKTEGQVLLGWRDVPVDRDMPMSPAVRKKEPIIRQLFIGRGNDVIVQDALERKLYVIRKTASAAIKTFILRQSKKYSAPACPAAPWSTRACCSRTRSVS